MDKLTGMEVAREIRKTDNNVKIVFSTSGNEFASESYEVNARYYLHKPFGIERVKAMLDRIDITGLEKMRAESLPDDSLIRFCENTAANAVLLYFAKQAKSNGIDYIVKADIPSDIFVTETDISVIFGNLLENALDACKKEKNDNKKIVVNASFENGMLCITVDNTYTGTLKYTSAGNIISTKHSGSGLGTQSVKNIADRYGEICRLAGLKQKMVCFMRRSYARQNRSNLKNKRLLTKLL